jgi:predicted DNA-binding transcriptional regulator YafY
MPLNKLALIRYKTIDDCLRNRARKWSLDNLIERVSDELYECEGIRDGVSRRTIQLDLQTMRSSKLYNAPIVVVDRKYYTYEDPQFSITQSKLTTADVQKLTEVLGVLKHLNGFNHFGEMSEMIAKLENDLHRTRSQGQGYDLIQFETNPLLRGLGWIEPLYRAVAARRAVLIEYRSFRARAGAEGVYYPFLLKEYRNRWFLLARPKNKSTLLTLALDRMDRVLELPNEPMVPSEEIDFDRYYDNVIGVSKSPTDHARRVVLEMSAEAAPYLLTKPLHASQAVLSDDNGRLTVEIRVVLNFELEREILGFGPEIRVVSPNFLAKRIAAKLSAAAALYPPTDASEA